MFATEVDNLESLASWQVADLLRKWEEALCEQADHSGLKSEVGYMLRSGILGTAIEVLARNPGHRQLLLGNSNAENVEGDHNIVLRLLTRVSPVRPDVLQQLLKFIVEAHDVQERSLSEGKGSEQGSQTCLWAISLLRASVTDAEEAKLLQDAAMTRAMRRAVTNSTNTQICLQPEPDQPLEVVKAMSAKCRELRELLSTCSASHAALMTDKDTRAIERAQALPNIVASLQSLRAERTAWVDTLSDAAARSASKEEDLGEQMRTSADTYRSELAALQKHQADTSAMIESLKEERRKISQQLETVDKDIASAEEVVREARINESRLLSNMQTVSTELCQKFTSEGCHQKMLLEEKQVILSANDLAKDLEAELSEHADYVNTAMNDVRETQTVGTILVELCVKSEADRLQKLEEQYSLLEDQWLHSDSVSAQKSSASHSRLQFALWETTDCAQHGINEVQQLADLMNKMSNTIPTALVDNALSIVNRYQALQQRCEQSCKNIDHVLGTSGSSGKGSSSNSFPTASNEAQPHAARAAEEYDIAADDAE